MAAEVMITPKIPPELKRNIDRYCKAEGMTIKGLVIKAIREFLATRKVAA